MQSLVVLGQEPKPCQCCKYIDIKRLPEVLRNFDQFKRGIPRKGQKGSLKVKTKELCFAFNLMNQKNVPDDRSVL